MVLKLYPWPSKFYDSLNRVSSRLSIIDALYQCMKFIYFHDLTMQKFRDQWSTFYFQGSFFTYQKFHLRPNAFLFFCGIFLGSHQRSARQNYNYTVTVHHKIENECKHDQNLCEIPHTLVTEQSGYVLSNFVKNANL